jgi:hypothetical protein
LGHSACALPEKAERHEQILQVQRTAWNCAASGIKLRSLLIAVDRNDVNENLLTVAAASYGAHPRSHPAEGPQIEEDSANRKDHSRPQLRFDS